MIGEEPFNVFEDNSKVTIEDTGMWIDIITSVPTGPDDEEEIERQSIDPADLNNFIANKLQLIGDRDEIEILNIKDLKDDTYEFSVSIPIEYKTIITLNQLRKLVK